MDEAENERMHLMTFVAITKPTAVERVVVLLAQGGFHVGFFVLQAQRPLATAAKGLGARRA